MSNTLSIVPAYLDMIEYVRAMQMTPEADASQLWTEIVVNRRWNEWGAGQFNAARTRQQVIVPVLDLSALADKIALVASSQVERTVNAAYGTASAILPPQLDRAV